VLSSEHRAAPAAPPVSLQLVATPADTTHLEVLAQRHDQRQGDLQQQVLERLAPGVVLTRAKLRQSLGVQNERLGQALQSLEQAGRVRRTPTGWRRLDEAADDLADEAADAGRSRSPA
jgi:predicted Rossmann fold nucleotide-binding protein DprA/Smf involved in DNA uptake